MKGGYDAHCVCAWCGEAALGSSWEAAGGVDSATKTRRVPLSAMGCMLYHTASAWAVLLSQTHEGGFTLFPRQN